MTTTTERTRPTVTDRDGKAWPMAFLVTAIKPLRGVLGHDPREVLTDPAKLVGLMTDPERLVRVAYLLLDRPAVGVPFAREEEFAAGLDANSLDDAAEGVVRLLCGMYAPRGKAAETADAILGVLREAAGKAAGQTPDGQ